MMYCMLKMKGGRTRSRQDGKRQDIERRQGDERQTGQEGWMQGRKDA